MAKRSEMRYYNIYVVLCDVLIQQYRACECKIVFLTKPPQVQYIVPCTVVSSKDENKKNTAISLIIMNLVFSEMIA